MLYEIVQDFNGSQDGRHTERFAAGTQAELSDYLAAIVVPCGWARPVDVARWGGVEVEVKTGQEVKVAEYVSPPVVDGKPRPARRAKRG